MHYFYMLECKDGTLYCGSAKDIYQRERMHNEGKGSKYVRSRGGGKIIYHEKFKTLSQALKREAEVKKCTREMKMKLIRTLKNNRPLGFARGGKIGIAALFDMDGVVADSIPYHTKAWIEFARSRGFKVTKQIVLQHFNGRINREILEYLYKKSLPETAVRSLALEKELIFRKIYRQKATPIAGLLEFLRKLDKAGVKIALATAGPPENVKLILQETKAKRYFKKIVNASHVKLGKPDPAIFLLAAKNVGVAPNRCVVFEDALNGIEAAKRAGMKVVGVASSHNKRELRHADFVVKDFRGLKVENIIRLFQ